jgi:protein SCO1/2
VSLRRRACLALPGAWLAAGWAGPLRAAGDAAPLGAAALDARRLPPPGSYTLPAIQRCPDGEVLMSSGRAVRLHGLLRGRTSVMAFMYTYCRDAVGCPLAWRVMADTREALLRHPALAARTQLVSLSFDPSNDTPQQMARYGRGLADDARVRWQFLTTASVPRLLPLLDGLGQAVTVETDAQGRPTRTLNHMLKVYLIDAGLTVREIYSVPTLHVPALVNDLRTLARV